MHESTQKQVLISVITPTFNRVEFLKECIESVQSSVIAPLNFEFEHIVSDDGSTDGTAEVMKILTEKYPNLKYIRNDENRGGSAVLNQAIEASSSEWIFVLDDDDVTFQRTLYNFANTIEQYGQEHAWFIFDFIRADENLKYDIGHDYYGWKFTNIDEVIISVVKKEHIIQHNTIYKKSVWKEVGGYDTNLRTSKDNDMYLRFMLEKNIMPKYLQTFSHIHRLHSSNLSTINSPTGVIDTTSLSQIVKKYKQLQKYPELKNYL